MSPELFERLDLLLSSYLRYEGMSGQADFIELAARLEEFLYGDPAEATSAEVDMLAPMHLNIERVWDSISSDEKKGSDKILEEIVEFIQRVEPEWRVLRSQINIEAPAEPSAPPDSKPKWRRFVDQAEAVKLLGCSASTVSRWISAEKAWTRVDEKGVYLDMEAKAVRRFMGQRVKG